MRISCRRFITLSVARGCPGRRTELFIVFRNPLGKVPGGNCLAFHDTCNSGHCPAFHSLSHILTFCFAARHWQPLLWQSLLYVPRVGIQLSTWRHRHCTLKIVLAVDHIRVKLLSIRCHRWLNGGVYFSAVSKRCKSLDCSSVKGVHNQTKSI